MTQSRKAPKAKPKLSEKEQSERFKVAAESLRTNNDPSAFEQTVLQLLKANNQK